MDPFYAIGFELDARLRAEGGKYRLARRARPRRHRLGRLYESFWWSIRPRMRIHEAVLLDRRQYGAAWPPS